MIIKTDVLDRKTEKPIVFDVFFNKTEKPKPLVIFCHGYKGYKDWGSWNLAANAFMKSDVFFTKFNFSYNGGTLENPIDFPDLEAFAENNYTKELNDLDSILNYFLSKNCKYKSEIDKNNVTVIGHSRGGGIAIIKTAEDSRITKLITWACICDFSKRTATIGELKHWQKAGVKYVLNQRTKQQMPHNYQFYKDFKANEKRLDIKASAKKLKTPYLIIHAKNDSSVNYTEAQSLKLWYNESTLFPVENSDHVFGAKQPWLEDKMPHALKSVVEKSIQFILNH